MKTAETDRSTPAHSKEFVEDMEAHIAKLKEQRDKALEARDQIVDELNVTRDLLRETIVRCNLAFPSTSQEIKWFDDGVSVKNSDFLKRIDDLLTAPSPNLL